MLEIANIANQIDLLLTISILVIGVGIAINIKHLNLEKLKELAISKKGMDILWMDSSIVGITFLLHQATWVAEIFFKTNTGIWFEATKTLFIASLGFMTFTWFELIKGSND